MTDHFEWDRLARYVSGESGATERADIERWAASTEANRALLQSLERRWAAAADRTAWNVDAAWSRMSPRLRDLEVQPGAIDIGSRTPDRSSWFRATRLVPFAAAAVLLIAVAVQMTSDGGVSSTTLTVTSTEVRTGVGEQRTIDLTDGTQVVLGAASTLRLGDDFGGATREVFLDGQAFLRVRHDSTRPFVVNAGGTRATDLGTAFEVRAYPNEPVRVAVTEGVVEVRRDSGRADSTVLQPGDVAEVSTTGETVVKRQQNVDRLLGWTRGELVFDDTPLSDVARELERWFDVQVRIEDPELRSKRWNVPLRIGESLDTILELIGTTLSIRAERSGNVVTFRRGQPVNPTAAPTHSGRVEAGA